MAQPIIKLPDSFAKLLIATNSHLGGTDLSKPMSHYVFGKRNDKIRVFDIDKTWKKLILAARVFCGYSNPGSITAISGKLFAKKAVHKFAELTGCKASTGRFVPGAFTNTTIKTYNSPRLVIVSDPNVDKQAITEASFINCPVIAFANTDSDLSCVDIAIPINNRSPKAIGASFYILSKLINFIRNGTPLEDDHKTVELFFYRNQVEFERLLKEQKDTVQENILNQLRDGSQDDFENKKEDLPVSNQ
ncbi:RSSA [Hepatospora eriocheir]|uniref:Small ribosomal subunit protein uS2 n=1 Tax=Hepatospora eriocheir TaxID=1081669 RepID=A0A1X0QA90_9MICR|nr:RSSA [Hepatospora eriocheir]